MFMRIILIINKFILIIISLFMKNLYKEAIEAYIEMLSLHIDTKTSDNTFHKESESFYETLFEVAHKIWEKYTDLWWNLSDSSLEDKKIKANSIIINLRKKIEDYKENNKISLWTEDLLGSLANSLEDIEWSSKAFLK